MAWYTRVSASSGPPLTLCVPAMVAPSRHDVVEYVDPHTGKRERISGILAWAGNSEPVCGPDAIEGTVVGTTREPGR